MKQKYKKLLNTLLRSCAEKSPKMTKAQKKKIKYFTKRVFFWQEMLGFTDMEIYVGPQEKPDVRATWHSSTGGAQVSVLYSTSWIRDPETTQKELDKTAFHEVYESQLYMIHDMLKLHYSAEVIDRERHVMVRRAENHIYPRLRRLKP